MATTALAAKEAALFRDVLKQYDEQQYKKAIKSCEGILKKVPAHGETLSMKGICVYNLGRKEEAYELVRQGLKCNLKCVAESRRGSARSTAVMGARPCDGC